MLRPVAHAARDPQAAQVLRHWFGEGEDYGRRRKCWFEKDPLFDDELRRKFLALYERQAGAAASDWLERPADCLARIVVLDQFPRNMFRASARAFAADPLALAAARHACAEGYDAAWLPVERLFAYLPFEHSESLADQREACRLAEPLAAFPETDDAHRYALAHLAIIERFGRFPHRNAALGRTSTAAEIEFLKGPGSSF